MCCLGSRVFFWGISLLFVKVSVSCDAPVNITDASYSPEKSEYSDGEIVTYSCNTGYEQTSGDLTLTCNNNTGLWEGTPLTCTVKTCAAPPIVLYSSKTPDLPPYNYDTIIFYTCETGYEHTSGDLNRTCTESSVWSGTEPVCTIKTCAAPAAVPYSSRSPSLPPYDYNTILTYTCDTGYEHTSGNLSRTCTENGTWSGIEPVCTIKTCAAPAAVPNSSRSPSLPPYDYNTILTYTCETGYEHTSGNLSRTCTESGAWSGIEPVCTIVTCAAPPAVPDSSLTPANQATYDYNTSIAYTCNTGFDHASGNVSRTCTSVGSWSGSAPVCLIKTCAAPAVVSYSTRSPDQPPYNYNTTLTYTCDTGYEHTSGNLNRICTESGTWLGIAPICTIKTCAAPAVVSYSSRSPNQPPYNYNTTLTYTCDTGYKHTSGNLSRTCAESGTWSGIAPICTIKTCAAPVVVSYSSRSPDQPPYNYNTTLTYTCDTGYEHTSGNLSRTCAESGTWSGIAPICTIVTCTAPPVVPNSSKTPADQATYDYNTNILYNCIAGFEHTSGNVSRICSAEGSWSGSAPVCTTITCAEEIVPHTTKTPDLPSYAFNDTVTYTCATGYEHTGGALERTCTSIDIWSGPVPVCTIVTCAAVIVADAFKTPDQASYDYNTDVTYACNVGYEQTDGNETRTCRANATWSGNALVCTIVKCAGEDIAYASKSPNRTEYDYNTDVTYTCEVGYEHTDGDLTRTCAANRTWLGVAPTCTLVTCAEVIIAHSSKVPDLTIYNYSAIIDYTCDPGYESTGGSLTRMCTASGTWTGTALVCSIKTCAKIDVDHATVVPDQPLYNYNTDITYDCVKAYNHTAGDLVRTCNASAEWTGTLPTCTVAACIEEDGIQSTFLPTSPSTLHNFGDTVTFTCNTGYNHSTGDLDRTCQNTGLWTGTAPTCTIVTCDHPPAVDNTNEVSVVLSEYEYLTSITYECVLAYNLTDGDLVRTCQANATWSGQAPVCTVVACIQEGADNSTFYPDSPTLLHNFGDVLNYTCNTGYNHSLGDLVRTCQVSGQWSGDLPTCPIVTCSQPPIPSFTSISPVRAEYIYQSVLTYTCELGYNRTNGDETRTCDHNAEWTGAQANCTLVTCNPPPAVSYSTYSPYLPYYNYSDSVTFTCDLGYYYLSGDMNRSCNEHGQWTGITAVCTIVQCFRIKEPHTSRSPVKSHYDFNTTVTYSCVTGYNMTGGDAVRECNYTGTWTNNPPVCTIVECDPPDSVMYASVDLIKSPYVYQDTLTYTCNLGYEITSGDATRTCDHTGHWTNQAPNCTIIHCPPPTNGTFTTYTPDEPEYQWNHTVDYTCIHGYNYSTGDLHRECQHDKTWSGITPVCVVITCDKVDIAHMTFDPPTSDTHDYGTTIIYACDVGYNHSYGDLDHTCTETREWTGVFPNCTIITCDPPASIVHTVYLPNHLTEHDWNTALGYTCEADYHYVSGVNTTTCNETGEFPPVDFDCSVMHTLSIDVSEPDVTVINDTVPSADIKFNFDGMCSVAVQVVPDGLDAILAISGSVITVTVSERADSDWNIYSVELLPTRRGRSWATVSTTVFYGLEIQGFQAWLDNDIAYIEIGNQYTFKVNVTHGTDVTLSWLLEDTINITEVHDGVFSAASTTHTYNVAGPYVVTIELSNFISSDSETFPVYVLYNLDEVSFSVDSTLIDTVVPAVFNFTLSSACQFPMGDVSFHIDFKHGSNISFTEPLNNSVAVPHHYSNSHLFDTQGVYEVQAKVEHALGSRDFSVTINVWDSLDALNLEIQGQSNNIFVTNTNMILEFKDYIQAGFEYSIDYGDGNSEGSTGTDILYSSYALSTFEHAYTQPGVYFVTWMAWNGHFSNSQSFQVIVQNEILEFQAWLSNDISYIEVSQSYSFKANATHGTNMTISWSLETTVNITDFVLGEFTSATLDHTFNSPGSYEIVVSISNLVSSGHQTFLINVLYSLDCLSFNADSNLANTTLAAVFFYMLPITCNFPMGNVDFFINFNHSLPVSFMEGLNVTIPLPHSIERSHLFDTQGVYVIYATAENILGERYDGLTVEVWDTLIPLKLEIKDNSRGNVFVTNTTASLEFMDVPNAGFEYSIDFGDGSTNHSSNGPDILYELYNLTTFEHVYTAPEVYTVLWEAKNGYIPYNRQESFTIIVQNEIEDFQAWLSNDIPYIEVGQSYTFKANATHGTNMTIAWFLEATVNITDEITGEFTSAEVDHIFNSPGNYEIVVSVANLVSIDSIKFVIHALYSLDCLNFSVDSGLANTTLEAVFSFGLPTTCDFPFGNVDFFIDFNHSSPLSFMEGLNSTLPLPYFIDKMHLFDTQGVYDVHAQAENILSLKNFNVVIEVWDTLIPLSLGIKDNSRGNVFVTNTTTTLEFMDVPNAGFEYFIDIGDGTNHSSNGSDILYELYSLTPFEHVYTDPDVYFVQWEATNGHAPYDRQDTLTIIVQNEIEDFQAWLSNDIPYIEVGQSYTFKANATQGTNMTIVWFLEATVTITDDITGELTSAEVDHIFNSPGSYEIVVSVANLVSSDSVKFVIHALYSLDCLSFSVDSGLANTTLEAVFAFGLPTTCDFPFGNVDFFIDFKHSSPLSFMEGLNATLPLPYSIDKMHLFGTQGVYDVHAQAENILSLKNFNVVIEVWDTLIPLSLGIKDNSRGNVFVTNTTTTLEFVDVPNSGFEYYIDFGDGSNHSSNGSDILYELYSLTPFEHVYICPEVYIVQWEAKNGHAPYDRQDTLTIIVQNEIEDFQAWLSNDIPYIEVGQSYTFKANATHGTNMTISWFLEATVTITDELTGEFISAEVDHIFNIPGSYEIEVSVANLVSSDSVKFVIHALYSLDCLSFSVDSGLANTTLEAVFAFTLPTTCDFPMGNVDFFIDFNHSSPLSFMEGLNVTMPLPYSIDKMHLFGTQGVYDVHAKAENILSIKNFNVVIEVWDTLIPLKLKIKNNSRGIVFATNTTTTLEFMDVPNAGFEYLIEFGDGNNYSSNGSDILYEVYSLIPFEYVYSDPAVYTINWKAKNGHTLYDRQASFSIIVQNEIEAFKAWLNNSIIYLAVGDDYLFEATGTQGTNVSIAWNFEPGVLLNDSFPGEYSYSSKTYRYSSPGEHNISAIASNLVNSQTAYIFVIVIYRINSLTFTVDSHLGNTTHDSSFYFTFSSGTDLPMDVVNFTINFKYGSNVSETHLLGPSETLPYVLNYQQLFDIQGLYLVEGTAENILGQRTFVLNMSIWDTLEPLEFNFYQSNGKYITNTTTTLVFENVPNAGFEYIIDYGDGFSESSSGPEILYRLYNLTEFNHTYTMAGIYTIRWIAYNGHYRRDETFTVLIQNKVPSEGFSLEPISMKYPWINLQTMDIPVNITLNETVPLPTNATCVFEPDDGEPPFSGLVYNESFFQHTHRFLQEGNFSSSLNCSNEVSWYVYTFSLCVQKYNASFLSVVFENLVPLNVSDTVTVYFHIDNGGFHLIPFNVDFQWDFGDGTTSRRRRSVVTYDKPVYTHVYSARGDYKVTLTVIAGVTSTTNIIVYDLRLGIMHFEYNNDIGFINTTEIVYTMYGVLGTDTTYTVDFADGTPDGVCNSADYSGCVVKHVFPYWGERTVYVVASNSTFVEVDKVFMTIDNPIVNLTLDVVRSVAIPNGTVDVNLRIDELSPVLPFLNCTLSMGDPISRDLITETQNVTFPTPFYIMFKYIALGRHKIEVNCRNLINETDMWTEIVVTNKDFLFTGTFDRQFSQEDTPLRLSSMKDNEITNRLFVLAPLEEKTRINEWIVETVPDAFPGRQSIIFPRSFFQDGTYRAVLEVSFIEEPLNEIGEPTYLDFISPPPHSEIVGGRRRISTSGDVTVDAKTLSYDLVFTDSSILLFSWECKSYTGTAFKDIVGAHESGSSSYQNCTTTPVSAGIVDVTAVTGRWYAVTVTVTNNMTLASAYTQYIQIRTTQDLKIICHINCLAKVAVTSNIQLVPELSDNGPATFQWRLQEKLGTDYGSYISLGPITETGSSNPSLTIKANSLEPGSWYLVTLEMLKDGILYGPAYYEFVTNRPPKGGSCRVVPYDKDKIPESTELVNSTVTPTTIYTSVANVREYNLTCKDWLDEGFTEDTWTEDEPLYYFFFLQYGEIDERQILYFDPGATSNLVTFQIGDIEDGYKATVVLRIADVFGDFIELRYSVISTPYLTTEQLLPMEEAKQVKLVEDYISQFDDELLKANQSYDYRTLARKIQGIASVYNAVVLNTSTTITLTPDDLLTLGYKRTDDGKLIKWADYWELIVEVVDTSTQDFLIHTGEKYVKMLRHSIMTWPSNRRISVVAIETMSRALNATLAKTDYSNVTAAILAAECAEVLAKQLASHVVDRTFPNTEDIYYASIALRDLIRNILSTLQTVLTPNLPVDPTVEEMRNYLLYIQVFKSEVEGTAPLSLQEQTFLAQKQLQKYHVAKYIKSEASKEALPHLLLSLNHLTDMFSEMIQIGQQEMYLENDFIYISAEITPAYDLFGTTVERPHAAIVLDSLIETHPEPYNGSAVTVKTTIFKHNPYFWGEWADRISSYVPTFEFDKAILIGDTIRFKLENAVVPDCIDKTPTYFEDDPDKMIYILFDRMYGDDDILLFIRPNATELIYKAYFNKDEKPSIEDKKYIYSTEINVDKWTSEDGYKVKISASEFSTTGKIWIALRPLLENSVELSLLTKPFCANVTSVNCLAWVKDSAGNNYWDRNICKVSRESSRAETVCDCENPGPQLTLTVGTTFYIPPNKIDFFAIFVDTDPLGNSPVLGTVIAIFVAFVLMIPWAWRADLKDKYKWSYALLVDNDIADSYFYLLRVYTGIRHGSGTKSNVGFVLVGEDGDTGIRIMDDDSHVGFEAGSVRNFVLSTRQLLGDVLCLRIWHDDSGGNESAWFLNKIIVTDLQTGKKYIFKSNQWLDYDRGDQRVDRAITAQTADDTRTLYEMAPYTAAENHLWMSIFIRPLNSNFTRVQRLGCILGLLYLSMIVCTLILKTPDEVEGMSQIIVGPFRFSMENFLTSFISMAVISPLILIVAFLFKNAESDEDDNEYLSCCRKGYKRVNDMVKVDKSVLSTDYIPPTHIVVRHFHFLPHFCVYVAWALLIMCVGMATWLMLLFSSDWKQEKSDMWMTTVFCAILLSVFIVEIIKVGIIIAALALLCNKAYDPPEPYIDVDRLREISKRNSHFLTKGPFYMNYLHKPPLPNQETLEENRRKRISNHQILKILYQLIAFGGVLYIVYMISFESRDPQSYYFKNHVEDMMNFTSTSVTDLDSYITWLNGTFVEEFFFSKYFGAEFHEGTYKSFTRDIANLRVGPARLRQLRIRRDDCPGPLGPPYIKNCYNMYADSRIETSDHCIGWKERPCAVSEKANFFTSYAWLYNSSAEVWGFPTMAEYTTYLGGGYFMKLDVNKDVSLRIFDELFSQGWIDRQTRVVIVEFTLYCVNSNLFAYAKFVAEFPEVGGVIPYSDIQIFRLYTNSSTILFLQFFFVLLVLAATVYMLYEICSNGKVYFKAIWNWLDMFALVMSYSTIGIFVMKLNILEKTIDVFHEDKNAYVSFENLAFYDFFANTTLGILVFLLSVRVSRILGYSGKINEMAAVITTSAGDLAGFLVIFGVTYFAYVQLGTMLFGSGTRKYRDMFHTYGTLTEAIVGKNRLANIMTSQPMLAEFYYFTFVLFVLLTLATMAAAILNFSISNVKKESKEISAPNIIEVIFDKIAALFARLTEDTDKDGKGAKNKQRRRSSTSELRDILSDFKHFLRDVKLESKEKYRVLTPEPN